MSIVADHLSRPEVPEDAPGANGDKPKRVQPPKADYAVPAGGFKEWPKDHSLSKHKPLRKRDFADEAVYYDGKAEVYEKMATRARNEAKQSRSLGNVKDRAKAKKLLSLQAKFNELKSQMEAEGEVDVAAILATLN